MRAGLNTLTAVIYDQAPTPDQRFALQLVENALREDLSPIEQARAFQKLIATRGWSARELARELSIDNSSVIRRWRSWTSPTQCSSTSTRRIVALGRLRGPQDRGPGRPARGRLPDRLRGAQPERRHPGGQGPEGRPARTVKPSRHAIKLDDGTRIIIEGTAAAAGEAAIADALALARKRILAAIREGNRGEAA